MNVKSVFPAMCVAIAITIADQGSAAALVTEQEIAADTNDAVAAVNDYWKKHFSATFGDRYVPPTVLGIVDEKTQTMCGPAERDNAFYCSIDHTINFGVDIMGRAKQIGDADVYMIVAHEWAHSIQAQIAPSKNWPAQELQADCIAGAVLNDLVEAGVLKLEDGDLDEFVAAYNDLDGQAWTGGPSDHGSAAQRIAQFTKGWEQGLEACL